MIIRIALRETHAVVYSRLLNYAHMIHKSREIRAELIKDASIEVCAMSTLIARRDASLIRFLKEIKRYFRVRKYLNL